MRPRFHAATPRGYSLIEMLIVMLNLGLVLGMSVTLLHAMLSLDRQVQKRLESDASLARLAEQLRSDAHLAEEVVVSADQARMKVNNAKVIYRRQGTDLIREATLGDQRERVEVYRQTALLPPAWTLLMKDGRRPILRLALPRPSVEPRIRGESPNATAADQPRIKNWRIEAVVLNGQARVEKSTNPDQLRGEGEAP